MKKLVCGVGVNDADYKITKKHNGRIIWKCKYYNRWENLLNRVYNPKYHLLRPTYETVTVCDKWLIFSNFKAWMEKQDWEGKQLDKDLLSKGKVYKIYSPETCLFVSNTVNSFILNKNINGCMAGVKWNEYSKCYTSYCSNPITKKNICLGYYSDELIAHLTWKLYKISLIEDICLQGNDTAKVKNSLYDFYSMTEEEQKYYNDFNEESRIYKRYRVCK